MAEGTGLPVKICHIWYGTYPDVNPERDARNALAQESWHHEYGRRLGTWAAKEVKPDDLGWLSALSPGNPMPFVHDLIDAGMKTCGPYDILFMTNADVGFSPDITGRIINAAAAFGAAHMKRKEIGAAAPQPTEEDIMAAPEYCGMDGTVMTPAWWDRNRTLMPDMVWGRFGWDSCLRNLIRWKGGVEIKDAIWHREHSGSAWNASPEVIYKDPANHHNRMLLWRWILDHGGSEADHLFADGELQYR